MPPYVPIFPAYEDPPATSQTSSQSSSSNPIHQVNYTEQLFQKYTTLAGLPLELAPSSCPPSPRMESRSELLREKIIDAVNTASADVTHPKWSHVAKLVRMGCTSRGYHGAEPGVKVGDKRKVDRGDYEWVLPDTTLEWWECEIQWKKRGSGSKVNGEAEAGEKEVRSKYWLKREHAKEEAVREPTKSERVREKVENWQAKIVPVDLGKRRAVDEHDLRRTSSQKSQTVEKEAMKDKAPSQKRQSPLDFQVLKRSTASAGKPSQGPTASTSVPIHSGSAPDVRMRSPPPSGMGRQPEEISTPHSDPPGIADLSEMSFLPPSFPHQLETSTPQASVKPPPPTSREKPPPIFPQLISSPLSSPHLITSSPFNPANPTRNTVLRLGLSSSMPVISPRTGRVEKRSRPLTPPPDEDDVFVTKHSPRTPPFKRPRIELERPQPEPVSSAPLPPSTPPPSTHTPLSMSKSKTPPSPRRSNSKGLGNAKGLPVPSTPDRNNLPTLTDLLASSRRSKPRPRPPSRKLKSRTTTPQSKTKDMPQGDHDALPVASEMPDPSPAKTYFSSPASGSSQSTPQSMRQRLGSPVSPLNPRKLSPLHMSTFIPPFVSTQQFGAPIHSHTGGMESQGGFLGRGESQTQGGFFAMGYSSQFDVEGHVGQVTDFLERDVDFDGWLKDIPDDDVEMQGVDGAAGLGDKKSQSQSQSQG